SGLISGISGSGGGGGRRPAVSMPSSPAPSPQAAPRATVIGMSRWVLTRLVKPAVPAVPRVTSATSSNITGSTAPSTGASERPPAGTADHRPAGYPGPTISRRAISGHSQYTPSWPMRSNPPAEAGPAEPPNGGLTSASTGTPRPNGSAVAAMFGNCMPSTTNTPRQSTLTSPDRLFPRAISTIATSNTTA